MGLQEASAQEGERANDGRTHQQQQQGDTEVEMEGEIPLQDSLKRYVDSMSAGLAEEKHHPWEESGHKSPSVTGDSGYQSSLTPSSPALSRKPLE